MRVLLVNPPFGNLVSRGRYNRAWPPLDLLNTAALLKKAGHQVAVVDGRAGDWSPAKLHRLAARSDLIVMTTSPIDRWQCPNIDLGPIAAAAKQFPGDRLWLAGVHGTMFPAELIALTGARGIIRGEPELTVLELAEKGRPDDVLGLTWQRGGLKSNPDRPPLDPAKLPPPAYDLVDLSRYHYEIMGPRLALLEMSRGCPYKCGFCLKTMYPAGVRAKPVEQVLDEVERAVRDYEARHVYFIDLEFTARRPAVESLCQGLIRRGSPVIWCCQTRVDQVDERLLRLMRRAGCRLIHFGVESACEASLRRTGKGITVSQMVKAFEESRWAGLMTAGFFQFGLPGEDYRQARRTLRLAQRLRPNFASFHVHTAYPGTRFGPTVESWAAWAAEVERKERAWRPFMRTAYARFYLRPGCVLAGLRGLRQLGSGGFNLWWSFIR